MGTKPAGVQCISYRPFSSLSALCFETQAMHVYSLAPIPHVIQPFSPWISSSPCSLIIPIMTSFISLLFSILHMCPNTPTFLLRNNIIILKFAMLHLFWSALHFFNAKDTFAIWLNIDCAYKRLLRQFFSFTLHYIRRHCELCHSFITEMLENADDEVKVVEADWNHKICRCLRNGSKGCIVLFSHWKKILTLSHIAYAVQ